MKNIDRWKKAQKAEKKYWKRVRSDEGVCDIKFNELEYSLNVCRLAELAEARLYPSILDDKIVVEIGCGPYGFIKAIDNARIRVGIDPLMDFFKKEFNMQLGSENICYVKGVGEFLPIKDECIDILTCHNTLDHVNDPAKVVENMNKILKKDALLMFHVTCHGLLFFTLRKIQEKIPSKFYNWVIGKDTVHTEHPHSFTILGVMKLLKSYKFEVIRTKKVYREVIDPSKSRGLGIMNYFKNIKEVLLSIKDRKEGLIYIVCKKVSF